MHHSSKEPFPQDKNVLHCCSPLPVTDWIRTALFIKQLPANCLLCTGGRKLKPSLVLLSPLRIESAFLPIMKPIPSPEQRLEVAGSCRSHHKKAEASTIYPISSLAIHVWGPKVMTLWLRCCKAKLIDQRLPGDWVDVCVRLGDPGSRNGSRMKLWEGDVAELGDRTLKDFPCASPVHLNLLGINGYVWFWFKHDVDGEF